MKIFKSKIFVFILVAAAFGLIFKNVVAPIMFKPGSKRARISQSKGTLTPEKLTVEDNLPVADIANLSWPVEYKRDPFQDPDIELAKKQKKDEEETLILKEQEKRRIQDEERARAIAASVEDTSVPGEKVNTTVFIEEEIIISAVMIDSGRKFAVIDDEIVSEGDTFREYRVVEITSDSVFLEGPNGIRELKY